jgi:hypothetical protein
MMLKNLPFIGALWFIKSRKPVTMATNEQLALQLSIYQQLQRASGLRCRTSTTKALVINIFESLPRSDVGKHAGSTLLHRLLS